MKNKIIEKVLDTIMKTINEFSEKEALAILLTVTQVYCAEHNINMNYYIDTMKRSSEIIDIIKDMGGDTN